MVTDEILTAINQAIQNFDFEKINDYLDLRDKKPFDENWVMAYETINTCIDKTDLTFTTQEQTLREIAFNNVATLNQHYELAE